MKLLVVEDERTLAKTLAKGLGKLGYAVDCAFDGEEALELYELNSYDLMILDLNLPKKDGRLGIAVSDTGIGMDQETLKHIFDPFYRADKSRSQKISGSGLGLSIVELITKRMEGRLRIKSEPEKGTTVYFFFPKEREQRIFFDSDVKI